MTAEQSHMVSAPSEQTGSQTKSGLYESDFYSWTHEQAKLLRSGHVSNIDVTNVVEELEALGRSELSTLVSSYTLISHHLLKLIHQPHLASLSWEKTIIRERAKIEDLIEDNPGLKGRQEEAFSKGYARGRRDASNKTGIEIARFPETSPFTRQQAETNVWPRGFMSKRRSETARTKTATKKPPQI